MSNKKTPFAVDRRHFIKVGVAASCLSAIDATAKPKTPRRQPNVLYVFDDQHRAASLPGEPFSRVAAPNIDAFRRANLSMDQCISNFPLCVPYRAVLMSGKYPSQSGVTSNDTFLNTSEFTLTRAFKASGYRVGYVGKWHLAQPDDQTAVFIPPGPQRFGIDDWHVWDNTNNKYECWTYHSETGEKVPCTKWAPINQTDQAVELITGYGAAPQHTPWMLFVSWNPPHPAYNAPQEDREANPMGKLEYRPNVKLSPDSKDRFMHQMNTFHNATQGYMGCITGVDIEFSRLLKTLDDTGQAKDTIVIFTSDHGDMLGSHGRTGKVVPYEESCHVPFSVRYPGVTPRSAASKQLFAAIDIYPTLCGLAGVPVPPGQCSGRDLSDVLRGNDVKDAPQAVFLMAGAGGPKAGTRIPREDGNDGGSDDAPPQYRGLRTERYTYAVTQQERWLLFDDEKDPYQLTNLANDPAHRALMEGFDTQLRQHIRETKDAFLFPQLFA